MLIEREIIQNIFSKIGTTNKFCVEFGIDNNGDQTVELIRNQNWAGLYIEADQVRYNRAVQENSNFNVKLIHSYVTAENINQLFDSANVPSEADLVSIDIDGMDYWVWNALTYIPRVILIEYNSVHKPPVLAVKPYDPMHMWDSTRYFGASLQSLVNLGRQKGYELVMCDDYGCSAAFVRKDLFGLMNIDNDIHKLYRPPRYGVEADGGHRYPDGLYLEI